MILLHFQLWVYIQKIQRVEVLIQLWFLQEYGKDLKIILNKYITNIVCKCLAGRAVAIRANGVASINNVFINGVIYK